MGWCDHVPQGIYLSCHCFSSGSGNSSITDRRGRLFCLKVKKKNKPTESPVVFQPPLTLPAPGMNSVIRESINPAISTIHQGILLFIFGNWYTTTCASFFSLNHSKTSAHKREHHVLTCYQIRKREAPPCEKVQAGRGKSQRDAANSPPFTRLAHKNTHILNVLFCDSPHPIMFKGDFLWVTQLNRSKMHQTELFSDVIPYRELPASLVDFCNKG